MLGAQQPIVISGRVVRMTTRGPSAVAGTTVTLHRIGVAAAGPVDSVTADGAGRYRFRVAAPDSDALYLPTSRFGGLAYFASPVRQGGPAGDGEIEVFDTTSAPVPIRVTGRHLVFSAPDANGTRDVVDVYELQNDSVVTRLGTRNRPAFVAALPSGAAGLKSTQGDFTGEAIVAVPAGAAVVAPVAPGVRQLALRYQLPAASFPLSVTLADSSAVVEVLLEESAGRATGDSLKALGAVTSEGRTFVRFLGRDMPAGRRLDIVVPGAAAPRGAASWPWLAGLGLLALGAVGWSIRPPRRLASREPASGALHEASPASRARELQAAIQSVEAMLTGTGAAPASHESLREYRDQLITELNALLAGTSQAQ